MSIAAKALELARREATSLLADLVQFRRNHPYFFYLVHEREATRHRKAGRRVLAWFHRQRRRYYEARWRASQESLTCAVAEVRRKKAGV